METISVTTLKKKLDHGESLFIVDVRTSAEVHSERPNISHLKNHPLDQIESLASSKNEPIYLICQTGTRSSQAYRRLITAGYIHLVWIIYLVIE